MFQSRVVQGSFKDVVSCKAVSRVFIESVNCVSIKFRKKNQGCFKNVSIKFYFAILFLMDLIAATRPEGGLVL